jgi:uncharacterized Fe-S cluster-containing radical SAM superfamily protein
LSGRNLALPLLPIVPQAMAPEKFKDRAVTANGETRAQVSLGALSTLWFNTGTLCNIECANCYIHSSPRNDALVYLTANEVETYLDEIELQSLSTREIGFTGGEPFMNREIVAMLTMALERGYACLVLTNAMKPMRRFDAALLELGRRYRDKLTLRVSLDHYTRQVHEAERGRQSWDAAIDGLCWLIDNGFSVAVAGRRLSHETDGEARHGYRKLFQSMNRPFDVTDPARLVLFPEMDENADVPEITESCWSILGKSPDSVMCASSRMVVKRRGAATPVVVACTLIPYAPDFELGETLVEAMAPVSLNHPHCASFCVLGGASCSAA